MKGNAIIIISLMMIYFSFPFFHDLVLGIFAKSENNFFQFSYLDLPSININYLHIIFVFFILLLLFSIIKFQTKITINRNNFSFSFILIKLTWITELRFKVNDIGNFNSEILTYLENNRNIYWKTLIEIKENGNVLFIGYSKSSKLLPISSKKLKMEFSYLINNWNLKGSFVRPYPKNKKYYLDINLTKGSVNLSHLIGSLQRIPSSDFELYSEVTSGLEDGKKIFPNSNNGFGHFKLRLSIGLSNSRELKRIKPILSQQIKDMKLFKFKTNQADWHTTWSLINIEHISKRANTQINTSLHPPLDYFSQHTIGSVIIEGKNTIPFGVNLKDFSQGGIICGSIGSGKTTLRLHIMKLLIDKDVQVIDFDLKGDAPRFYGLSEKGKTLVPGKNFKLNPFLCPKSYSIREYGDILVRTFIDTVPNSQQLTSAQQNMLTKSVHKTIREKGNSFIFFKNILELSLQEKSVIDNYQENTAQALIVRFNWMQNSLGDIFWGDGNTLSEYDYLHESLFFDFSFLTHIATHTQIRFIQDLIITKIMSANRNLGEHSRKGIPRTIIFIDEAQILMPKNPNVNKLTRAEEALSTLRYKGISVIAAGVSAELMSSLLLDTGFIAQYQSESKILLRNLNLFTPEESSIVPKLSSYHALIKAKSGRNHTLLVNINEILENKVSEEEYNLNISKMINSDNTVLPEFSINFDSFWEARINGLFSNKLLINDTRLYAVNDETILFLKEHIFPFGANLRSDKIRGIVDLIYKKFIYSIKIGILSNYVLEEPDQFIFNVLRNYYLLAVQILKGDKILVQFEKNYVNIVIQSISLLSIKLSDYKLFIDLPKQTEYSFYSSRLDTKLLLSDEQLIEFNKQTYSLISSTLSRAIYGSNPHQESNFTLVERAYDLGLVNNDMYYQLLNYMNRYDKKIKFSRLEITNNVFKISNLIQKLITNSMNDQLVHLL
jgi:hypothetical protein